MRLLVDESTGKKLVLLLAKSGHDVLYVGDIMPSASDEEILRKAQKEGRILVSDDKDFGELIVRLHQPTTGVILIRTETVIPKERHMLIEKIIKEIDPKGKLVIIKEDRVRIRQL